MKLLRAEAFESRSELCLFGFKEVGCDGKVVSGGGKRVGETSKVG
jgi:hypothetical protein